MAKTRRERDGKHLWDLGGGGGTESVAEKREDVFDAEHRVPPSCSLALAGAMLARREELRLSGGSQKHAPGSSLYTWEEGL